MTRDFIFLTLIWKQYAILLGICTVLANDVCGEDAKPNIIVILTDDQGYQDIGCYGSPDISTPHLDHMASEGMKFTSFYSASPVCSPSRASLMTGCYPYKVGVKNVLFPGRKDKGLAPKYTTVAEVLKTVGYSSMAVGKWHLGDEKPYLPTNQGFDSYYGIPYSNDMYPAKSMEYAEDCVWRMGHTEESLVEAFKGVPDGKNPRQLMNDVPLMRDEKCIEFPADQETITQRYTDEAIKFMNKKHHEKTPFFLFLSHTMPHTPLYASPAFKGKSKRGIYGDVIEEIDDSVGRLTAELKRLEIDKNTLVVFTSDNGPWLIKGKHGGSALPLFEGKMTHFEGGQRVPCIVKWPTKVPANTVSDELVTMMDLLPTFAAITGADLPSTPELDGKNAIGLMTAQEGAKSAYTHFFYGTKAVRSGEWKYHTKEIFKVKKTRRIDSGPSLYHLGEDIGESVNLIKSKEHESIAESLRLALKLHKAKQGSKK